ncbi:S41 family peptidase [Gaoshiqia sp. Z1-71]|uniref:S41 family peptidase n=1 Tax=Gaoshiqia hydrogeniformans TaxID=3290090 RepID=UPI003BF91AE6
MKKFSYRLLLVFLIPALVFSCKDDNDIEEEPIPAEVLSRNAWIKENMEDLYFWNNKIPNIDETKEADSEEYFYKLVYDTEDEWSWITDDYPSLAAEYSGVPVTMGYAPAFYLLQDNSSVVMVVKYVYPGSAAAGAGLKRGDLIISINNTNLNTSNYYSLYSGTSYSVQLGAINNNVISPTGTSLSMTARVTTTNPSIHHEVITVNSHKIGYLAYVEFISGDQDVFLHALDNIFTEFNTSGITDLVVDLRYNPGGEIDAAAYLASAIAPASVVAAKDVLVNMRYNNDLQAYLEYYSTQYAHYLAYRFTEVGANANLQRVYFLATDRTASASELLMTGLEPYMDVIHIGEATYGKYAGAWVMADDDEQWAMIPIVMKYANKNGYTDFVNGLQPDYPMDDDIFGAVPFGDPSDPMLAKAIELITGETAVASVKSAKTEILRQQVVPKEELLKQNLIVPRIGFEK